MRNEPPIQVLNLLGTDGIRVLERAIECAQRLASTEKWPLRDTELYYRQGYELPSWQYALLVFVFDSSFEDADRYLHEFYDVLNQDMKAWSSDDREILVRLLYFDVRTWEKEDGKLEETRP